MKNRENLYFNLPNGKRGYLCITDQRDNLGDNTFDVFGWVNPNDGGFGDFEETDPVFFQANSMEEALQAPEVGAHFSQVIALAYRASEEVDPESLPVEDGRGCHWQDALNNYCAEPAITGTDFCETHMNSHYARVFKAIADKGSLASAVTDADVALAFDSLL